MGGFVYILQDRTGKYYVGSTDDLKRRLRHHARGYTQTTRNMNNPEPVLVQEYSTLREARKIERKIKSLKRKDFIAKMVKDGFIALS